MATTAILLVSMLASLAFPVVYDLAVSRPYQQQQQAAAEQRAAVQAEKQYSQSLADQERISAKMAEQQQSDSEAYNANYEKREHSRRRARFHGSSRHRGRTTFR